MISPLDLEAFSKNLHRIANEKLSITIHADVIDLYDKSAPPSYLRKGYLYMVRLRRGSLIETTFEATGRSEKSLPDALDNALRELDAAGALGARLEPAAQDDNVIPF